jgi:hypothetical protein
LLEGRADIIRIKVDGAAPHMQHVESSGFYQMNSTPYLLRESKYTAFP